MILRSNTKINIERQALRDRTPFLTPSDLIIGPIADRDIKLFFQWFMCIFREKYFFQSWRSDGSLQRLFSLIYPNWKKILLKNNLWTFCNFAVMQALKNIIKSYTLPKSNFHPPPLTNLKNQYSLILYPTKTKHLFIQIQVLE